MSEIATTCPLCGADLSLCHACNGSACATRACWVAMECKCSSSGTCACSAGRACPKCAPEIAGPRKGWSTVTVAVSARQHRSEIERDVEEALEKKLFSAPTLNTRGDKVNREAWLPSGAHVGVEERVVDGAVRLRGMWENEARGIRCLLPTKQVERIRAALCPAVKAVIE